MESSARREEAVLTPREIYERLDRFVIGQDGAKRAVAIAAHNHLKRLLARRLRRTSLIKKSNILLIGPTGSGKTHIARNLADILQVPFTTVDATEYTEAGYYGKDVEVMISDLLFKANTPWRTPSGASSSLTRWTRLPGARRAPGMVRAAATLAARVCSSPC